MSATLPQAGVDATFRLLVVDDEEDVRGEVRRQFEADPSVEVIEAVDETQATEVLTAQYVDAAIVDIKLASPRGGLEVIRDIGELAPTAAVVVVTRHDDLRHSFLSSETSPVIAIYEKAGLEENWARRALAPTLEVFRARAVAIRGIEVPLDMLDQRERRKRISGLRSRPETAVELDRLCRRVFGEVSGIGQPVEVILSQIKRAGLGPAVTVAANVQIGRDLTDEELPGAVTVLKIGPRAEIEAEVARYEAFVKYGVRLTHRVELLGWASEQALGAISYSFAGGVFGVSLTSLDDLLRSPTRDAIVEEALENLFQVSSRNWYRVKLDPIPPSGYFLTETKLNIQDSYERLDGGLRRIRNRFPDSVFFDSPGRHPGELRVGDAIVRIPPVRIWGAGAFIEAQPTSLIHGDMHGGNVLVELAEEGAPGEPTELRQRRVCLIDFRNSGRGPRLLDFVSLETSVRLADADTVLTEAQVDEPAEDEEQGRRLLGALREAASRVEGERLLLEVRYENVQPRQLARWQQRVLRLHEMAAWNFDAISEREYLTVASLYVLRHFGYSHATVERVRLLAWLDALTERLLGTDEERS